MVPQQTAFDAAPAKPSRPEPSRPDAKIWANWLADCWTTAAYWANGGGIGYLVGWLRRWLATDIRFFGWIPEGQRYDCLREFRDRYFAGGGTQPP
jgi:hypothetical protein